MMQLTIDDAIAEFDVARFIGDMAGQRCADKAETMGFSTDAARAFVLNWLTEYGASWGEDITDAARKTAREDLSAHDDRAWGPVFASLARQHRIRCIELGMRRKGNGTAGARRWSLVQ
jgi:hypothetical protein